MTEPINPLAADFAVRALNKMAATIDELGWEREGGTSLRGSGADHAAILYTLLGDLGWWPPQDRDGLLLHVAKEALADYLAHNRVDDVTAATLFEHDGLTCDMVGHYLNHYGLDPHDDGDDALRALLALVPLPEV